MMCKSNQLSCRIISAIMVFLLLFGLLPVNQIANAETTATGWKENITLTGRDVGKFTLDSNTSQMFFAENAVPGDVWEGEISIENRAKEPMEVSLLSISSKLEDKTLFNTLDLDIWVEDITVYAGKYGETSSQITPYYVIPSGSTMKMDVRISFPPETGNIMQGKKMDSTWTFEARYVGSSDEASLYPYCVRYLDAEAGKSLIPDKQGYAGLGNRVTEYAPDIAGYQPDALKKSITMHAEGNVITFYYYKANDAVVPNQSEPPSETTPESVRTGEDMAVSNTTPIVYAVIAGLSFLSVLIVCVRIRIARRRIQEQ